jgi:hypothetical protein
MLILLLFLAVPAWAGPTEERAAEKGTYLGLLFSPLPALTDARTLSQGVLITHILPDSPAAKAGLRRRDVVLKYDGTKIRDCEHLARLIRADKPKRKVRLLVQRGKKELTVEATLTLGPALKVAPAEPAKGGTAHVSPPGVSVLATPLDRGKMKLTIEYYATGRLHTVTCEGAAAEIASAVQKLPERERNLVRVALQRLRRLNTEKATPARRTERP